MSTGLMNKRKWGEDIQVNGAPQHTDYPVKPGDVITVDLWEPAPGYPSQQGKLDILYEDDYLLAVDKPAGMLIHPSAHKNIDTLANFVAGYYESLGENCAFHPLTRLDRDTFGLVLIAKSSHIHALLQGEKPRKTYHALTFGAPEAEEGIVDAPIARRPLPSLLREVNPQGKESLTAYRVLTRGEISKLSLNPITGRTHQLRLHCAHLGCPILGDPQYGSEASQALSLSLGYAYQQLCAREISFVHPMTGEELTVTSHMDVEI